MNAFEVVFSLDLAPAMVRSFDTDLRYFIYMILLLGLATAVFKEVKEGSSHFSDY